MALFARIMNDCRALFRRSRAEEELDAELRAFLEAAVEQKMRAGLNQQDAIRAVRLEMGSVEALKDRVRDVGWESSLDSLLDALPHHIYDMPTYGHKCA